MMIKTESTYPLVTVYMPTYNRVELLQRAVQSVLNQDYKNIELIVVDDNSTDSTHEYLARIAETEQRFKYFINEKNSGACVSRNKAIFAAKGEFITGLDDDDYFLSYHISRFIELWQSNPDYIAIYSNIYVQKINRKVEVSKPKSCNYQDLICGNWIGNQVFTRTQYLKTIEGFDEELTAWQDLECWYRLLKYYDSKAILSNTCSYIVDISHPHERITSNKINSIHEAYDHFCTKHNLSKFQRQALEVHLSNYTGIPPNFKSIISSFLFLPNLYNLKSLLKMQIRPFWLTLKNLKYK